MRNFSPPLSSLSRLFFLHAVATISCLVLCKCDDSPPEWLAMGPSHVQIPVSDGPLGSKIFLGGAIEDILISPDYDGNGHPAMFLACSDNVPSTVLGFNNGGSGIWRSTNFTGHNPDWICLTGNIPDIDRIRRIGINNIRTIAINPNDSREIWAGAGGTPLALLKSTDGGDNWSMVGEGQFAGSDSINKVLIDPTGTIWVACDNSLFASSNNGVSFTRITSTNFPNASFDDISFYLLPDGSPRIIVGVVDTGKDPSANQSSICELIPKRLGGYIWAKMPLTLQDIYGTPLGTNLIHSIRLYSDNNLGTVASIGKKGDGNPDNPKDPFWGLINVFKLEDRGWQPKWRKTFPEIGNDIQDGYVQPICLNPDGKIIAGGKGVSVSDGKGGCFPFGAEPDVFGQRIHVDVHKVIYSKVDQLMYMGTDGGLVRFKINRSSPGGVYSWEALNSVSLKNFLTESVAFNPFNPHEVLVGTQDNGVLHLSNNVWSYVGGNETDFVYYDPFGIAYFIDCSPVGGCKSIQISKDGGRNFPGSFTFPGVFFRDPLISFHTTQQGWVVVCCKNDKGWPAVYETPDNFSVAANFRDLKLPNTHDHFYTTDPSGEGAFAKGYNEEGPGFYVLEKPSANTIALLRWYNRDNGDHFYDIDASEERKIELMSLGYRPEKKACYVYKPGDPGHIPVFRWYNPNTGDHFYTTDVFGEVANERGYIREREVFRVSAKVEAGAVPFFRWYNELNDPTAISYAGDAIYVSIDDKIFRTFDHGHKWTCIWQSPASIMSFCYDPPNSAMYISTEAGTRIGTRPGIPGHKILYNPDVINNPANFIDITGTLDIPVSKMVLYSQGEHKSPILYAVTKAGIYRTTTINGASTEWNLFGVGLPDTDIRDIQVNPVNHWLYVATYGRGVWNIIDADQISH